MIPSLDLFLNRKSVRAYTDQPITVEEKEIILRATLQAPTAGNMMLYTIVEVNDQGLKDRLAVTCDNQPFIARAPWVLLFLADYQRWYDYYLAGGVEALCKERGLPLRKPEEGDLMLAACDTLIAAHTAVMAAEALGIGSCYIGDILEQYETHRDMFCLPPYALPITLVCFGRPTDDQKARNQPTRFEKQYIVHQDQYHRLNTEELEEMFKQRNEQLLATGNRKDGITNVGQFNYMRKFSAPFSIEMSRSVRAMIDAWVTGE